MRKSFFLLALAFLVFASLAYAKSYSLEKAELYYKILPDGLVIAEERITFNFIGSFSYAYRTIPFGQYRIDSFEAYDITDGLERKLQVDRSVQGSEEKFTWHYSASNERRTFLLRYKIVRMLKAYDDVAEFYWKVWGSGWSVPVHEIFGYVELPDKVDDASKVYTWGHPEINGKIGLIENRKVLFQAFNIPANQWVELRVVFPRQMLTSTSNAMIVKGQGLQKIIDEEKSFGQAVWQPTFFFRIFSYFFVIVIFIILFSIVAYIYVTKKFRRTVATAFFILFTFLFVLFPVIYLRFWPNLFIWLAVFLCAELALFVLLWFFLGREPKVDVPSIYEREPPYDYSPAVVEALMNPLNQEPTEKSMPAEILDLCLRGKLKLEKIKEKTFLGEKDSYKIIIVDPSEEGLPESEAILLRFLCEAAPYGPKKIFIFSVLAEDSTPNEITLNELIFYLRQDRSRARSFFNYWQNAVKNFVDEQGFFSSKNGFLPFIIGTAIISLAAFFFTEAGKVGALLIILFAAMLNALFPGALPKRTAKGAEHYIRWVRFKKFLSDFSSLKTVPPDAIALWEKYLVYAIPLGVADKVQRAMEIVFKDYHGEVHSSIFVAGAYGFSAGDLASISNSFSSAFASAVRTSGSGGFGGGGSGGGGGGGGGAG